VPAGAIAHALYVGASNLSFHLKALRQTRWLVAERRGQQILYRADYDRLREFLDAFRTQCCADAPASCDPVCRSGHETGTGKTTHEEAS